MSQHAEVLRAQGPCVAREAMQGPTAQSHWIVPSLICVGPAPDASRTNLTDLQTLIDCGITRYVDLRGPRASNYLKLAGLEDAPDPSRHVVFDMAASVSAGRFEAIDACAAFFREVVGRALEEDAMTYIHAEDGLAYEAAAACGILSAVYGLSGLRALAVASQLHGCRENTEGIVTLIPPTMRPFVKELSTSCMKGPIFSAPAASTGSNGIAGTTGAAPELEAASHGLVPAPSSHPAFAPPTLDAAGYATPSPLTQPATIGSPVKQRPVPSSAFAPPPPMVGSASVIMPDAAFAPTPVVALPAPSAVPSTLSGNLPPPGPSFASAAGAAAGMAAAGAPAARPMTSRGRNSGGGVTSLCIVGGGATDDLATPTRRGRGARPGSSAGPSTPLVHAAGAASAPGATATPGGFRSGTDAADPLAMSGTLSMTTTLATAANAAGDAWPPCFDPRVDHALIRGPTPVSNWVVRGRVCCGAAPRPSRPREVEALARERFDYLVCLEERDTTPDVVDDLWVRNAGGIRPQTLHFPLADGRAFTSAQQAQVFLAFVRSVVAALEANPLARVYVYCHGGHGRTGMFVSLLLGTIYRLPGMRAVGLCERLHELRVNTEGQGSPQTQDQRTACISLLAGRVA